MSRTPDPGPAAPPAGQPGSRPSLFAGSPLAHDDGPVSILSAMDDAPATSRPKLSQRQLWPWLGGGLLAAVGLIWVANHQKSETERPIPRQTLVSASSPAPVVTVASAPLVEAAAASSPAIIEVTVAAAPTLPPAPTISASTAATDSPPASDATLLMATAAGVATATAIATAPEPAAKAAKKPSKRSKVKAKPKAEREAAAENTERGAARKAAATGSAGGATDADVDLIAAVMRHGEAPAAGRSTSSEATAPSSIASLVTRCKSLGGDDAKTCRQRLCEGYWGKAEACPKRLAPKSSAKTTAEAAKRKKKKARAASSDSKA